jgi:hypothetical protein
MKRVFLLSFLLALCCGARALAVTEYCPASVSGFTAIDAVHAPASLYSYIVSGEGARVVQGTVMVDTDAGWYAVAFAPTSLSLTSYHYKTANVAWTRTAFESALLYVRFPKPVSIRSEFVANAEALRDDVFGWSKKGLQVCQAPAGLEASYQSPRSSDSNGVTLENPRNFETPPQAGTHIVPALAASPPGSLDCNTPFTNATVIRTVAPALPPNEWPAALLTALIEVAVGPDGQLDDAWVEQPSGAQDVDDAALASAKASAYRGGTSFCKPAPGRYIFRADFSPA